MDDALLLDPLRPSNRLVCSFRSNLHIDSFSLCPALSKYMVTQVDSSHASIYDFLDRSWSSRPGLSMHTDRVFLESANRKRTLHQAKCLICYRWSLNDDHGDRNVLLACFSHLETSALEDPEMVAFGSFRPLWIVRDAFDSYVSCQ